MGYPEGVTNLATEAYLIGDYNNPNGINGSDPITSIPGTLNDGESRLEMGFIYASRTNRFELSLFMTELDMSTQNNWNWEPNWIAALQQVRPDALLRAKWRYLKFYNQHEFRQAEQSGLAEDLLIE